MYKCPVQELTSPFYDQVDEVHRRIAEQAAAWMRPLLAELSAMLPGRRLEYGDGIAMSMLPGVAITPPVRHGDATYGLLEDLVRDAPEALEDPERAKRIDDTLRAAGIRICDDFGGIGDVAHDPDETIN